MNRLFVIIIIASVFITFNSCVEDDASELIREFQVQDSLQNRIPELLIVKPMENDTTTAPFTISYQVINWDVSEGGRHIQYFINGENKGAIFSPSSFTINKIDTGKKIITLKLARENFITIDIQDEISVIIKPQPTETYALLINNGLGSGNYKAGEVVEIIADLPVEGFRFSTWEGDTEYISDINNDTTTILMPDKNIEVTASYVEIGVSYELEVRPIMQENCDLCHSGLWNPKLLTCDEVSASASTIAERIVDPNNPMPQVGLMPQEKIDVILKWIEQGANCN